MSSKEPLITEEEAAEQLGISPHTLKRWRQKGKGPTYVQMGRTIRYRGLDLFKFVQAKIKEHPAVFEAAGMTVYEPPPWMCQIAGKHTHPDGEECVQGL